MKITNKLIWMIAIIKISALVLIIGKRKTTSKRDSIKQEEIETLGPHGMA